MKLTLKCPQQNQKNSTGSESKRFSFYSERWNSVLMEFFCEVSLAIDGHESSSKALKIAAEERKLSK